MAGFKEAFAKARKEKGANSTFTWNGKSYSTNYKEESSGGKKAKSTAPSKSPKPKARPEKKSPMDGYRKGDITTTKLDKPKPKKDKDVARIAKVARDALDRVDAGANRKPTQKDTPKFSLKDELSLSKAAIKKRADLAKKERADLIATPPEDRTFGQKLEYNFSLRPDMIKARGEDRKKAAASREALRELGREIQREKNKKMALLKADEK